MTSKVTRHCPKQLSLSPGILSPHLFSVQPFTLSGHTNIYSLFEEWAAVKEKRKSVISLYLTQLLSSLYKTCASLGSKNEYIKDFFSSYSFRVTIKMPILWMFVLQF